MLAVAALRGAGFKTIWAAEEACGPLPSRPHNSLLPETLGSGLPHRQTSMPLPSTACPATLPVMLPAMPSTSSSATTSWSAGAGARLSTAAVSVCAAATASHVDAELARLPWTGRRFCCCDAGSDRRLPATVGLSLSG